MWTFNINVNISLHFFLFFLFLLNRCNFFFICSEFSVWKKQFPLAATELFIGLVIANEMSSGMELLNLLSAGKWGIFPPYSLWSDLWLNTFLFATWMVFLPLDAVCCFILDETVIPAALFSKLCLQERKCDLLYCWMMTNFCLHKSLLDGKKIWFLCLWELISIMKFHY